MRDFNQQGSVQFFRNTVRSKLFPKSLFYTITIEDSWYSKIDIFTLSGPYSPIDTKLPTIVVPFDPKTQSKSLGLVGFVQRSCNAYPVLVRSRGFMHDQLSTFYWLRLVHPFLVCTRELLFATDMATKTVQRSSSRHCSVIYCCWSFPQPCYGYGSSNLTNLGKLLCRSKVGH